MDFLKDKILFLVISSFVLRISMANNANSVDLNSIAENQDKIHIAFEQKYERTGKSLHNECGSGNFSPKCLKIQALSFLEDLSSRNELSILPGISIVKENSSINNTSPEEVAAELSRQFPGRPDEKINRFLLYRLQNYLDTHSLRYKLLDPETTAEAIENAKGEATRQESFAARGSGGLGGGGKKGGGLGGLLAAGLMMKGTLAAAAIGALALLAGKALMTALMSLLLSALVGLKGGGGGHKSTTYEIITKPVVSHHNTQSHEEHHEHEHGYGHHDGYRRAYNYYE